MSELEGVKLLLKIIGLLAWSGALEMVFLKQKEPAKAYCLKCASWALVAGMFGGKVWAYF